MNYPQALAWLYGTQLCGIKLGLEQIRRLLGELGFAGSRQRFLHVAGTNGKGSLCAMLDAVCRAQGIRTGLFTSPHLVSFRERIKLDGAMIGEREVAHGLAKIREIISGWETHPTFFEITTALALDYFQRENADVVALETGLGGRLDSTNVVTPRVSVITPVGLDHQTWLGSTLAQIAAEKAGIIKPRVPVVSAAQHAEAAGVLIKTAREKDAPIEFVTGPLENVAIHLAGSHQKLNAALALAALRAAAIEVSDDAIQKGLGAVEWPGRFQIIQNRIILDGAHNPSAVERLAQTWREIFGGEKATVVLGVLRDKEMPAICRALLPIAAGFVVTPVRSPRTSSPEKLYSIIHEMAPCLDCSIAADLAHAVEIAAARPNKILITGSLFLVGEALTHFDPAGCAPEMSAQ